MIPVRADLEKLELVAGLDLQAHFPQRLIDRAIDHRPPILGREHQVVEQHRDVVTLWTYLLIHSRYAASGGKYNPKRFKYLTIQNK